MTETLHGLVTRLLEQAEQDPSQFSISLAVAIGRQSLQTLEPWPAADAFLNEAAAASVVASGSEGVQPQQRVELLVLLTHLLRARFERAGDLLDLDAAIGFLRVAVAATPGDAIGRLAMLGKLASLLRLQFERTGAPADLNEAIGLLRTAVAAAPDDSFERAVTFASLGAAISSHALLTADVAETNEAIHLCELAVAGMASDHPDAIAALANLGAVLQRQYELTGNVGNLERAIETFRRVLQATPSSHHLLGQRLSNLGSALYARYEYSGELSDLTEAAVQLGTAVSAAGLKKLERFALLSNLGNVYQALGQTSRAEAAYGEAMYGRLETLGPEHPETLASSNNLATILVEMNRLDEAARIFAQVSLTQGPMLGLNHPDTLASRNNLATVLAQMGRLDEAASALQTILQARQVVLGTDHPDTLASHNNLATVLAQMGRLDEAASALQTILQARQRMLGTDHPETIATLAQLQSVERRIRPQSRMADVNELDAQRAVIMFEIIYRSHRLEVEQFAVLDQLTRIVNDAFGRCGIPWDQCVVLPSGDGMLVMPPRHVRLEVIVNQLPTLLASKLRAMNERSWSEPLRIRMAVDRGIVRQSGNGYTGTALISVQRMIDSPEIRHQTRATEAPLGLIVSDNTLHEAVSDHSEYSAVELNNKNFESRVWIRIFHSQGQLSATHTVERPSTRHGQLSAGSSMAARHDRASEMTPFQAIGRVTVREAMSRPVLIIGPHHTLRDAAKLMSTRRIGSAVILDPDGEGPGIITERDVLYAIGSGLNPDTEPCQEHITWDAVYAHPDWSLEEAAMVMTRGGFRHLVVVEDDEVIGIVSVRDLMRVWSLLHRHIDADVLAGRHS